LLVIVSGLHVQRFSSLGNCSEVRNLLLYSSEPDLVLRGQLKICGKIVASDGTIPGWLDSAVKIKRV